MFEIDEISLLVYLNRINRKDLVKTLCKYTGCHEGDYPESELIRLLEKAISDITRKYHIRGLWFNYFEVKRRNMVLANFNNDNYNEINTLQSTLFYISPDVFDDEDKKRLEELKKEYLEEE